MDNIYAKCIWSFDVSIVVTINVIHVGSIKSSEGAAGPHSFTVRDLQICTLTAI